MNTPYQPKPIRILWEAEPDSGWEDDYFDGILVRDYGALYRSNRNAWLALVEPTETAGLYRIDGADLQLISKEPLEDIARMLSEMSALDYLLKVMPDVMLPDEMPI
ncbi:hypothetical protein BSK49_03765 [Paenibacillus odorifer]|uniref:hypothetical protein n=1 Tax=Paenibacillus odorifer TaxID=189426 RepID=UPI00096F2581|nr:hypothetical protein [Paenibacillus odorifer]OMD92406.1 hypothetical protein BSK49_03765 [Paenibacillus odorifer]